MVVVQRTLIKMVRRQWLVGMAAGVLLGGPWPLSVQAIPLAQTLFESQPQDALQRAAALNQRALELYQAGQYQEAIPLAEAALEILREQLGERHPDLTASLNNLAFLYNAQGRYGEAEPLYQEALSIRREQWESPHPDVALSLNNLAALYYAQGRYGEAEPLFQEALTIYRGQFGDRYLDVARGLNNLALLHYAQGDYRKAEPLFAEALAIYREQLGEAHPSVALSLNNLAGLYDAQGRYAEAEPLYQQSLAIYREQLGEQHPDVALSLGNLADLYRLQGRYGEAEALYQEVLVIYRESLGDRHPDVANALNNLAVLYQSQGRYGEAETRLQAALAIHREQFGDRHPAVTTSLSNLANLYRSLDRHTEAERLYQEVLAADREQFGDRHPNVATSLNNLAVLYDDQNRYGEAEAFYQEALAIYREQFGDRHPNVAEVLNNLATLYRPQGRYAEAEALLQEALAIRREQLGERHPAIAQSLSSLTALHQAQGRYEEAIATFQAGLTLEERHLEINLTTLTDAQRQDYAATLADTTDLAITLSLRSPAAQPLGLTTLLRRKGRLLEASSGSLQRLRQNLTAEDAAVLNDLVTVRQQLAHLTFNAPAGLPSSQYREQLAQLEAEAQELEKTLAQRSALFRVDSEPVEIEAVRAQLPADGVLVEYVRYRPFDAKADQASRWGTPRYAAYLLFPDGTMAAIDLGEAAMIDAAVRDFIGLLQNPDTALPSAGTTSSPHVDAVAAVTETIQTLVFDPIAPYLQADVEHLLISPDSQLNLLPFAALQSEAGGNYLVQQYQISYLNSGRDLLKFELAEPSQNPAIVLADPDYEIAADPSRSTSEESLGDVDGGLPAAASVDRRSAGLSQLQFGRLPGTAAEAEAIRPLLPNATILTAADATENTLKRVVAPRLLHIATHGFFLEDIAPLNPETRGIGIVASESSDSSIAPSSASLDVAVENPLLRSGLALAGFNRRSSGREDGVLTALEAANLNLVGTQLVVLSACETGLGDIANGEGVYGLRRAFALAGAESQLMSLWQVSDFGTQSLMARYYENLTAGMGRSEALRAVQLEMLAAGDPYGHPFYWSAFILAGDWRSL